MDFKVSIKCEKCKCVFELRSGGVSSSEHMACPNCGQKLEASIFAHCIAFQSFLHKAPFLHPIFMHRHSPILNSLFVMDRAF